jgi:hypothetical protein
MRALEGMAHLYRQAERAVKEKSWKGCPTEQGPAADLNQYGFRPVRELKHF